MIEGVRVVDAHLHLAHAGTLKMSWSRWSSPFGADLPPAELYFPDGRVRPAGAQAWLDREGIDVALLFSEYSPKVTGIQAIEDAMPLVEHNPRRFRPVANLNPHYHHPVVAELERQVAFGAAALKLHPVHGGFSPAEPALYPVYAWCERSGLPVVLHCGTSTFTGSTNRYGDPALLDEVLRDFPGLSVVLAHGGRGWWYDAAAFLALANDRVWIDISGLPPRRLRAYYARADFDRLAARFIFGTDWPGAPGLAANARAVAEEVPAGLVDRVLSGNANAVYRGIG